MLGFLFGFNARLGRLHFFLATIASAVLMTVISIAIAGLAFQNAPKGMIPSLTSWQVIAAAVLFIWVNLTLQSMRIRDIGWDPVCVIPAWFAASIIDGLVAGKIPAIALGGQLGTIVGALVNLALFLALLFWPSSEQDNSAPTSGDRFRTPDLPSRGPVAESPPAPRISPAANGGFGRRGL
jgi:uncharacterized membrane protein YhaH (DUF805 family)